jgi:type IV pilus assembly protein PilP
MRAGWLVAAVVSCVSCVLVAGCGSSSTTKTTPPPSASQRAAQLAASKDAGAAPLQPAPHHGDYAENEFTESDRSRDPFRSFARTFVDDKGRKGHGLEVPVVLAQYSIDELKLVGIATGGDYPRAMLVDPTTKGWVVKKGDYIGRPEVVHVGGANGADYQLNWRVERVRDGDIVLTREDPAQPLVPPATRVIPLHPEADKEQTGTN